MGNFQTLNSMVLLIFNTNYADQQLLENLVILMGKNQQNRGKYGDCRQKMAQSVRKIIKDNILFMYQHFLKMIKLDYSHLQLKNWR